MLLTSIGKADSVEVINSTDNLNNLLRGVALGTTDGVFVLAPSGERRLASLMRSGYYRLVGLNEWADGGYAAQYSFIRPATIPAGTYPTQTDPITTVSTQLVLASPSKTTQATGDVGPGTVGIGSEAAIPVSAGAVKSIRETLGMMDVIDPAIPVHGSLVPKIVVVDKSLPFSPDISIINIVMILFTVWVIYLIALPSPRDFKMPEDV
jgi:hypothetical protein